MVILLILRLTNLDLDVQGWVGSRCTRIHFLASHTVDCCIPQEICFIQIRRILEYARNWSEIRLTGLVLIAINADNLGIIVQQ